MRKGFTLIELLAVIVILAIIAVIAVPIVLDIIDDSKKNATLRSAEMYLDAVEMSKANLSLKEDYILNGTYNIKDGNICLDEICIEVLDVEIKGEVPKNGTIVIKNGTIFQIDFSINDNRIIKNSKGEIIYFPCTLINGEENVVGSEYVCEVTPGVKYKFYVLSYNDENNVSTNDKTKAITTNLIMDQNIYNDGSPAGLNSIAHSGDVEKYSLIKWNSSGLNADGPSDVLKFLYDATKNWINIPSQNYIYNDRENQSIANENDTTGYISFSINNGVATVTSLSNNKFEIGSENNPLRARLPIHSTYETKNEVSNKIDANAYLYEYLDSKGPYGYWTLSSNPNKTVSAQTISFKNVLANVFCDFETNSGVRPVITLKL